MKLNKDIRKKTVIFGMILALLFSSIPFLYLFSYNYQKNPNKVTAELKSSGNTWTVDDDGPADFDKIQDAIDVVSSGDVILVYPGLYIENLFIRKSLTIKSSNGPELTTILPHISTSDIIKVYGGNNVFIEGFTLADSHGQNRNAIYVVNSEFIYISNNKIINNDGGIRVVNSEFIYISDNKIINNDGGIRVFNSEFIYISNNRIEDFIYTGIIISSSDNCEVSFNFINGTGLMETAIAISGTSSTFSTNHLIEYNLIENCISGIELGKIRNSMIKNNKVFYFLLNWLGTKGISIWTSDHTTIQNNICKGLFENILLGTCTNIIVTDNICNDGYYGIRLSYDNFNNQIEKNYCANNRYIGLSLVRSSYNTISTNTFVSTFIQEASDCIGNIFENNIFYQDPICNIELQKDGNKISEIDIGEYFEIYVGDSSDDIGIEQVRFSSDDEWNGIATGEWTDWYEWDTTSGDWDADAKTKHWAFATVGLKEVWAEINNTVGATDSDRSWITATSIYLPPVAEFTFAPDKPIIGEKVKFNASDSNDPDGGIIVNYLWDFGDGNLDYSSTPYISHSYNIEGPHEVKLRVWDDEGSISEITKPVNVVTDWSYVIITDLHIGRGYPEYNREDYYLTERLEKVVDDILNAKDENNIKFVAVLGDLSEVGDQNELLRARRILNRLNDDGIPYFPVIGNHDVHTEAYFDEGDWSSFNLVYSELFFTRQFELLGTDDYDWDPSKYVNYAFHIGNINFVCIDFVQDSYKAKVHINSKNFLKSELENSINNDVVLFSHHPFAYIEEYEVDLSFEDDDLIKLKREISGWTKVKKNFAGHIHGFYDPNHLLRFLPPINPNYRNANKIYHYQDENHLIPGDFDVITTEALMVASNEKEPKGIVRLAMINSDSSEGKIDSYDNYYGFFDAVNPYLKIKSWRQLFNEFIVDFTIFPFTGHGASKRFTEISYTIDVIGAIPISGDNPINGDWEISKDINEISPLEIRHRYKLESNEQRKEFRVKLTMYGQTLENNHVVEVIEKRVVISKSDPLFFSFISFSPVDLEIIDPGGLIINKSNNEIEGAIYLEYDLNEDSHLDDIVIIPEKKEGDYYVNVIPEQGAQPTDTYSLLTYEGDLIYTLAENVQIFNIPTEPYIVDIEESEIKPIIPATIDFDPDTLNLECMGKWITVYIELPIGHGYDISEIDISSILLNDQINANLKPNEPGDYDLDGIPDLMVKFELLDIQEILQVGKEVSIIITGKLEDERIFRGKDTIRVISHEEIVSENEESYSQPISYPSLISANALTLQLVALVGIVIILVITPKKRISSKF